LKPIKLRDTIIGVLVGHDTYMIPFGFGVMRSKVKVTETWSTTSCPLNYMKAVRLRDTIIVVLVGQGGTFVTYHTLENLF